MAIVSLSFFHVTVVFINDVRIFHQILYSINEVRLFYFQYLCHWIMAYLLIHTCDVVFCLFHWPRVCRFYCLTQRLNLWPSDKTACIQVTIITCKTTRWYNFGILDLRLFFADQMLPHGAKFDANWRSYQLYNNIDSSSSQKFRNFKMYIIIYECLTFLWWNRLVSFPNICIFVCIWRQLKNILIRVDENNKLVFIIFWIVLKKIREIIIYLSSHLPILLNYCILFLSIKIYISFIIVISCLFFRLFYI